MPHETLGVVRDEQRQRAEVAALREAVVEGLEPARIAHAVVHPQRGLAEPVELRLPLEADELRHGRRQLPSDA